MELNRVNGVWVIACLLAGGSGCAVNEVQDFGDAVRHMQVVQTAEPEAEGTPLDGELGQRVMQNYRADVAKPKEVRDEIIINIGN